MQCNESTLTHPTLSIEKFQGISYKVRNYFHVGSWGPPVKYTVHHSSIVNLARGLLTRVFYRNVDGHMVLTPRPCEGIFKIRLDSFLKRLKSYLLPTIPITRDEFPLLYKDRRQKVYQDAVDSLYVKPLTRKDAHIKAFVKAEKICIQAKRDPDPRVIQPRDPRYNVEVGRFLKPIEKDLYQAVARVFHEPTIFKGFNAHDSGRLMKVKWDKYQDPVAVGLDASRFDQCVSRQALEWEHQIYLHMFHNRADLAKLLEWQIANVGTGYCRDGKLRYSVDGCRMSGDMNTALGNCIIMCALVYAYCEHVGVRKYSLANNGDDCIVIMNRRDLQKFTSQIDTWFLDMGFAMKVEDPVFELEEIEFCQTHPVIVPDGCIMVRNMPTALAKDCISIKPLDSSIGWSKWANAVGECGISLAGGIPIAQEFYSGFIRGAHLENSGVSLKLKGYDPSQETGLVAFAHGMSRKWQPISEETRYSFWKAFNITPGEQIAMELWYASHVPVYRPIVMEEVINLPPWI
jgi:hypothetical protein